MKAAACGAARVRALRDASVRLIFGDWSPQDRLFAAGPPSRNGRHRRGAAAHSSIAGPSCARSLARAAPPTVAGASASVQKRHLLAEGRELARDGDCDLRLELAAPPLQVAPAPIQPSLRSPGDL